MTAVSDVDGVLPGFGAKTRGQALREPGVHDAYWGYAIVGGITAPRWLVFVQAASYAVGVLLCTAALGVLTMPSPDAELLLSFRVGAAIPVLAIAALLLSFSCRGRRIEIEIDTTRGEVREVMRNRAGRSTLIGRYGFDAIGSVFIERVRPGQPARLVLRYRNTAQVLPVAIGDEADLATLRDRLALDLMLTRRPVQALAA